MKPRICTLLSLIVTLALFPVFAASGPSLSQTPPSAISDTASSTATQILAFVEAQRDIGLYGAQSVAVSPDGQHVYAAGYNDDSVAVFSRDDSTGGLNFVEKKVNGSSSVNGLNCPHSIAVSPDGNYVYVASWAGSAVVIFSRNASTGALTYEGMVQDGDGSVDGLQGARSVVVSPDPDGSHVYVAGQADAALAIFSRNASTGALTYEGMVQDGDGDIDGLYGAWSVAISPDGKHVYVAGKNDHALAIFSRNESSGALTFGGMVQDDDGGVDGLADVSSVTVSPDGQHVYAAGEGDNAIAIFGRNASTGALIYAGMVQDGDGGVDGLRGARSVVVSPDGKHIYAVGEEDDAVAIFSRNTSTGALTYEGMVQNDSGGVDGLNSPRSVVVSPGGSHVYVAAYFDNAVSAFDRDESTGELTFVQVQRSVNGLDGAVGVAVSPDSDGQHVYVTGNDDDMLVVFGRDALTGALTYVERETDDDGVVDGLDGARSVAVSPDGNHVYVVGHEDDAIAIFSRDAATGRLTYVDTVMNGQNSVVGLDGPQSLTISPDGSRVYAACYVGDGVVIFDRDQISGALTFKEWLQDGVSTDSLDGAYAVAVTSNGDTFYVASINDNAVSIFYWAGETLYYLGAMKDGVDEVDGLDGANSLALTSDDRHLYVASRRENAVAIFSRSSSIGALTYRGKVEDGVGGVDGLGGARAIAVGPDDRRVYVASQTDHALAVFGRDAATGALTFLEVLKDTDTGVNGLSGAGSVAVGRSGRHVYVTGYNDDAVVVIKSQFLVYLPLVVKP